MTRVVLFLVLVSLLALPVGSQAQSTRPGLKEVQVPFDSLRPTATFKIGGTADWVLVTDDAVWVGGTEPNSVLRAVNETAKQHRAVLAEYLGGDEGPSDHPFAATLSGSSSGTSLLAIAHATISYGVAAYTMLSTMAFRQYDPRLRELAPKHLKAYASLAQRSAYLLVEMTAEELAAEGLECHCVCPMCGLGACG